MTIAAMEMAAMKTMAGSTAPLPALAPNWRPTNDDGTFAAAMAAVDRGRALPNSPVASTVASPSVEPTSAFKALARQLDEVGRHRVEAQALSDDLAGAWASGVDAPALGVSMHRQARAMASYNLSVMWGAKLVGVTAGALRQLVAAA